jgi:hypothetical protein
MCLENQAQNRAVTTDSATWRENEAYFVDFVDQQSIHRFSSRQPGLFRPLFQLG